MKRRKSAGPSGSRPTIRDVARAAGVSTATVSNVLSGQRKVAGELCARVFAVVAELGYRTDSIAASLRRKRADIVGLIVPEFANPFFGELIAHLERLANAAGYRLFVASSNEQSAKEVTQVAALIGWRAAGLLIVPTDDGFAAKPLIRHEGAPAVVLDRVTAADDFDSVGVENANAAADAARHLIRLGHRRILVVGSDSAIGNIRERLAGVASAFAEAGLAGNHETLLTGLHAAGDADAIERRLRHRPRPTAIFALTNMATLASLQAISRQGLVVPRDVSIVGFDDYEWMQVLHPAITAVRQPMAEIARAGWDLLMRRLGGETMERRDIRLPCTLMVRGSSARPRKPAGEAVQGGAGKA